MTTITYTFEIDFGQDGTYGHAKSNISGKVQSAFISTGSEQFDQYMAATSSMALQVRNEDGEWWQDNPASEFYGLLKIGLLVRCSMTYGGTTQQLYEGKLRQLPAQAYQHTGQKIVSLQVTGPMDDLRVEYRTQLNLNQRTDQEITRILSGGVWAWPYRKSGWILGYSTLGIDTVLIDVSSYIDIETGVQTLDFTGDVAGTEAGVMAQDYLAQIVDAELGGYLFWDGRSSTIKFLNRQYAQNNTTVQATFSSLDGMRNGPAAYGDIAYNAFKFGYAVRELGPANSVLWEASNVPIRISAGKSREFTARYRMDDYPDARIGGYEMQPLFPGFDYAVNTEEDGTGDDITGDISIFPTYGGTNAKISIDNPLGVDIYITTLQCRGTPLIINDQRFYEVADADSIAANDRLEYTRSFSQVSNEDSIQSYASIMKMALSTASTRFKSITYLAGHDAQQAEYARDLNIGDRIRVNLSSQWTKHDVNYIIVGESHEINKASGTHYVTLNLKPAALAVGWLLGVAGSSELGETTILAF